MATKRLVILVCVIYSALAGSLAANNQAGMLQALVKAFAGPHRFHYLFIENGTPYLDEPSHLQVIEVQEHHEDQTAEVAFFHQTETGKGLHFKYVIQADGNRVGRVSDACGYSFETSSKSPVSFDTPGYQPAEAVFNPSLAPLGLPLSTPSLSTSRFSTCLSCFRPSVSGAMAARGTTTPL